MFRKRLLPYVSMAAFEVLSAFPAAATFHIMQIEQVIGGVNGDTNAQAIQLRQRASGQNLVSAAQLIAYDASEANPVVLINFSANVANSAVGSRILITTSDFNVLTNPAATPDFSMTNPIPPSYLTAGKLTFEDDLGVVFWSISWGGAGYTGSNTGDTINDSNGDFGPAVSVALPSSGTSALKFNGSATASSTSNAADYSVTAGAAVFTNNLGGSFTIIAPEEEPVSPPPSASAATWWSLVVTAGLLLLGGGVFFRRTHASHRG